MQLDAKRRIVSWLGFGLAIMAWKLMVDRVQLTGPLPPPLGPALTLATTLLPLPAIWLGRHALDARPTADQAAWVTTFVHYAVAIPLGLAGIAAVAAGLEWPCDYDGWLRPLALPCPAWPPALGTGLMAITGLANLLAVADLALRGLGAPFAIALSRRLATDRLYGWTRNPMVLAALAFLVSTGIWLGSWWFIGWAVLGVAPVMLAFLKVYEERELELRFGAPYIAYRRRTPMLFPRPPRR